MKNISVLIKPVSGNCNMTCEYCFYCDEMKKRQQSSYGMMSDHTLKNVVRKTLLQAENAISYVFQGGEPTLSGLDFFKKVIEYQRQYNKNNIIISNSLQTNGYEINEEWCKFFNENNFLIGVSIDGTKEVHDRYRRGKTEKTSSYDRIANNIKLLDKCSVDYNILTVVTAQTVENIDIIYKTFKKNAWNYQQYIECLDPYGEEQGKREYSLTPRLYGKFLIRLFELWYSDWKIGCQPSIRKFENYIGILLGYEPESCDQRGYCGIQIVVEADGSVFPCDFFMLDEYLLGNLNDNRLPDIHRRRDEIGFVNESFRISSKCIACKYYSICRGGCQRNRAYDFETNSYHSYLCESYQIFFDECMEKLQEIAEVLKSRS